MDGVSDSLLEVEAVLGERETMRATIRERVFR